MSDHIQRQFEKFHAENPHVLATLEDLAGQWFRTHDSLGIGMLWEVMRWSLGVQTEGDTFRLNNNYRSRYARLLIERHPEWASRIETRALTAAA